MTDLPTGTVTFLFTDLEGSTRLWEDLPDAMRGAMARHDEILREAVEKRGGVVVKTTGDGLHAAFARAHGAIAAAVDAQRRLAEEPWALPDPLRVRMGVHTGEADLREGDYFGTSVNRAARVSAAAHGGQIVVSHATEELARDHLPVEISLEDLGEHHLRDLARPERVFQVRAPGLAVDFPPLRSLDAFPGNLPARQTSFVGRDKELAKIAEALRSAPIVTLTGVGGVGKTRLAVQVAAEVLPHFPDGGWLSELAAADSPDALHQVVATALGVPSRSGMGMAESIVEFLRAKHLLLVLDNCEHLLDAAADLAERIVETCPEVRLLATSREGLAVDGEQVVPLRSLGLPGEGADAGAIEAADAVQLFIERARAAQPDFSISTADLDAVAEVCRRLDGIPLAIELAAARTVAMSPSEIAALLDERFRLLTGGRRSAVERHQTLRATVDWSYGLLDERERLVFDRLGVFAGTFDGAAATAVVTGEGIEPFDVLDALTGLVGKSMVVAERAGGTTRYFLLETLRQYAREQLDAAGGSDHWRRRHAEHYLAFARDVGPGLRGPDEIAWRTRLMEEFDNVRVAVNWGLDRDEAEDALVAIRIVGAISVEAAMRRGSGVGAWAVRALERADLMDEVELFDIRSGAVWDLYQRGDLVAARDLSLEAIRDGIPPSPNNSTSAHACAATSSVNLGDIETAMRVFEDGLVGVDAHPDAEYGHAALLASRSMSLSGFGRTDEARVDAEACTALARRLRNPTVLSLAALARGWSLKHDDEAEALAALEESIAICESGALQGTLVPSLAFVAPLRHRAGDTVGALDGLRTAILSCRETGERLSIITVLLSFVSVLTDLGEMEGPAVAAGVLQSEVFGPAASVTGFDLDEHQRCLDIARETLGDTRYNAVVARGASLSDEEALDRLVDELDRVLPEQRDLAG